MRRQATWTALASLAALVLAGLSGCTVTGPSEPTGAAGTTGRRQLPLDTLVAIERRSWDAWKGHDGAFFAETLADDHLDVGFAGPLDKASVVAGVASPACTVRSFAVDRFRRIDIDPDTALLVYRAEQDTTCGSFRVPSPTWVSSLYVRRAGRWRNVLFQQTATPP